MRKGFTLIELLAVIVILAVIALIAIPLITNVIAKAKQGAAESSALGYIDAAEKRVMINKVKSSNTIEPGEYSKSELATLGLSIKGEVEDALVMINEKGKVIQGRFCINGYSIDYDGKQSKVNESVDYCDHIDSMVFVCPITAGQEYTFDYTGDSQTFTVPCDGKYKVELWGASGASISYSGGNGGYSAGEIELTRNKNLYIYVGGQGAQKAGGYNGGGGGLYTGLNFCYGSGGGGATDIRLVNGAWDNQTGLNSRIMVAAGGGSATQYVYDGSNYSYGAGGAAGGLTGYVGTHKAHAGWANYVSQGTGGTQTTPGALDTIKASFGFGTLDADQSNGGGGGGYYGGGSGNTGGGAAGGSAYISGHTGCVAIAEGATSEPREIKKSGCTTGTTDEECSIHYSGLYFTNTVMIDGNGYGWTNVKGSVVGMPTQDGTSTMNGNSGNGYAKITNIRQ